MQKILSKIDKTILDIELAKPSRTYLGASGLGVECDRQLWYSYKMPKKIQEARIHRIMHFGFMIEAYAISLLKNSGYEVFHEDEQTQYRFEDEELAGSMDGVVIIDGVPHLLEIKSANDKRFGEMKKNGVRSSDPVYYTQMQVYMKYFELEKSLFFAINKNTSEIYMEIVDYDKKEADFAVKRGKRIAREELEPERKYTSKAFYKCRYCSWREECWGSSAPISSEESPPEVKLGRNFLLGK